MLIGPLVDVSSREHFEVRAGCLMVNEVVSIINGKIKFGSMQNVIVMYVCVVNSEPMNISFSSSTWRQ